MKEILLKCGTSVLLDADDYILFSKYKWRKHIRGYASRSKWLDGRSTHIFMHREILKPPVGYQCDHINGNKLDNRRINLRICTRQQNLCNVPPRRNRKFKGVYKAPSGKFLAAITLNSKSFRLGLFLTEEAAAQAYDTAAKAFHGEFARLNFV